MMDGIHEKVAVVMGWTVEGTKSFSLATLREMVRLKDPVLAAEIAKVIQNGDHIYEPAPPNRKRAR